MESATKELLLTILFTLISIGYFFSAILPPKVLFPPQSLVLDNLGDFLQPSYSYVKKINLSGTWNLKIATMNEGLEKGYPYYFEFHNWNRTSVPLKDRSIVHKAGVWLAKSFIFSFDLSNDEEFHLFFNKVVVNSYIWINGYFLAFHKASILPFSLDVTQFIHQGNNTLVLFLDTSIDDSFGILSSYDGVEPIVDSIEIFTTKGFLTRSILVTPLDEGSNVKLKVSLIMESYKRQNLKISLNYEIYPEANLSEKLYGTKEIDLPPGLSFQSFDISIRNPSLWQPLGFGSSTLYNLLLNFSLNNEFAGSVLLPFGIRTIDMNSTSLFINKKFVYLRGLTITDVASFNKSSLDYSSINFIHLVGFKKLEWFANYCDRTGRLLVISFPKFSDLKTQVGYILMFYNHPSIVAWSEDDYRGLQLKRGNQELIVYSLEPSKTSRVISVYNPYSIDYRPVFLNREIFSGSILNFLEGFLPSNKGEGIAEIFLSNNLGEGKLLAYLPLLISRIRVSRIQFSSGISLMNVHEFNSFSTYLAPYLEPLLPILDIKGDYEVTANGMLFNPERILYIRVWLVNDLPLLQKSKTYSLNLTLYDATNKTLLSKIFIGDISLPSYTEYPRVITNLTQKISELTQGHKLSFYASIVNLSKIVSETSIAFYSLPMTTVDVVLQKPISGFFVVNVSNNFIIKEINGSSLSFKIARAGDLTIYGPFSVNGFLVPFLVSFKNLQNLSNESLVVKVPVLYGSKVELMLFPYIVSSSVSISSKIFYTPVPGFTFSLPSSNFSNFSAQILNGTDVSSLSLFIPELNFLGNSFIVPPNVNVSLSVSYLASRETEVSSPALSYPRGAFSRASFQGKNLINFTFQKSFITASNSTYEISDLANFIRTENEKAINNLISDVYNYINSLEAQGYYIEGTKEKVFNTLKLLTERNSSNVLLAAVSEKVSYESLSEVLSNLRTFASSSPSLLVYMFLLTGVLSLLMARIMFERPEESYFTSIILFIVLLTTIIQTFPQTKIDFGRSLLIVFLLLVAIASLSLILYTLLENVKTAGGISLFAAISIMLSFISGFLSKRKFRTFLVLLSIVIITWGLTCLSSVSTSFTTYSQTTGVKSDLRKTYLVLESTSNSVTLTSNLLYFLNQIKEIRSIIPKLVWVNLVTPLDTIAGVPISGVISISTNSPLIYKLESVVSPKEAVYEVASSQGKVIISDLMAQSSGKQIGDLVFIKGKKYQIAGILNSKALSKVNDVDEGDLLPKVITGESLASIPEEDVIVLNVRDMPLGSFVNKLYLELEEDASVNNIASAVSMFQNLFVYVAKPNSTIEVYYPGNRINIVGLELIFPIILGFLMIFLTFSSYTYERRKEIFILTTVGANPDHIFLTFLYESTIVGFIGGALGYILGIATFRFLSFMSVVIPVDVKVDIGSSIMLIFFAIIMSVIGALLPSFRASVSAVPSLRRRWSTEAKLVSKEELDRTQQFNVTIPIVIPTNKAAEFASFLAEKLRENAEVSASISNVSESEELSENEKVYKISFSYLQTGNRPFKSQNTLVVKRVNDHYELELHSKITTIFTMFADMCLKDVASFVRELSLRWSTEGDRIAVFVHSSKEIVLDAIRSLRPRYVLVISRSDPESIVRSIRSSMIQHLGYNIAIEGQEIRSSSFREITKELESYLSSVEMVYINSDDYLLSSAAVLALTNSGKKMVVKTPQGEFVEVNYKS